MTAEDQDTRKHQYKLYEAIDRCRQVRPLVVDQRDFKYKQQMCKACKNEIKWKVQAEVDVAIAVYLIDYALTRQVKSVTLFAGDRDFLDSIEYVQAKLKKMVRIMSFDESTGLKIKAQKNFIDVTRPILEWQASRKKALGNLRPSQTNNNNNNGRRERSRTPDRRKKFVGYN